MDLRTIGALAGLLTFVTPAAADMGGGGGDGSGSSYQESLYGDMQKNPRLIEPGAHMNRPLAYYGREGWDERQAAARAARRAPAPRPGPW